jgi:hypothetical protein
MVGAADAVHYVRGGGAATAEQRGGDQRRHAGRDPWEAQQQVHVRRHEGAAARVRGHLPQPLPNQVPRALSNLQDLLL